MAINNLMKGTTRQLQMYDVMYNRTQTRPRGLALSLIDNLLNTKPQAAQLQLLPPQTRESIDAENKAEAYDKPPAEEMPDTNSPDLPPELQPVLQESGLPCPPEDESEIINDGLSHDFEALDLENAPDFDPDQDPEAQFYANDAINAWIKADQEECAKGAKPRLYQSLDIPKDHPAGIYSEDHNESLVTRALTSFPPSPYLPNTTPTYLSTPLLPASSSLAPNLLIYQIPSAKSDDDFIRMYQRYAYMTSHGQYQRTSCFRQDDLSIPRWLLVQEFGDLYDDLALKKKEAEYLWRKNGWEGVKVEFFRARGRA